MAPSRASDNRPYFVVENADSAALEYAHALPTGCPIDRVIVGNEERQPPDSRGSNRPQVIVNEQPT